LGVSTSSSAWSARPVDLDQLVAPAKIDQRLRSASFIEKLFQVLLLDVEHGKEAVVHIVGGLHAKHAAPAVDRIAETPRQPHGAQPVGNTDLLQDFQATGG
jgi:hypothetical protein